MIRARLHSLFEAASLISARMGCLGGCTRIDFTIKNLIWVKLVWFDHTCVKLGLVGFQHFQLVPTVNFKGRKSELVANKTGCHQCPADDQ